MSCVPSKWTTREKRLYSALLHLMYKNHETDIATCWGCRDVAAWIALPGYDGELASPGGVHD